MRNVVEIIDMSYEGAGVGRLDGKIVFVPKTLVGDVVEIKKIKENRSFIVGEVVSFEQKSQDRGLAKCPYFDKCGGCAFQHCDGEKEKEIKKKYVAKEFQKVDWKGEIGFVSSQNRFFYRNKIKLDFVGGKLGFYSGKNRKFVDIKKCFIADEKINVVLEKVRSFLDQNCFSMLKSVYIKKVEEEVGVCFLFEKMSKNPLKNAKNVEILQDFSVFYAEGEVLEGNSTKAFLLFGKSKFEKNFGDFVAEFDISAFNQINDFVAEKLYQKVVGLVQGKRIINAYSGQGVLSMFLAKKAKFVYGIEYQKTAHESAEKLANQLVEYKLENVCGRVEEAIGNILLKDNIDAIVLDPAREGCAKKVLDEVIKSGIKQIVYVSCNFATQIRDVKVLQECYKIKSVEIFDMFPCTANVETLVVLERR